MVRSYDPVVLASLNTSWLMVWLCSPVVCAIYTSLFPQFSARLSVVILSQQSSLCNAFSVWTFGPVFFFFSGFILPSSWFCLPSYPLSEPLSITGPDLLFGSAPQPAFSAVSLQFCGSSLPELPHYGIQKMKSLVSVGCTFRFSDTWWVCT